MISVVIPAYNVQECLPRCFDSLIGATVNGVVREVIVADGGSSDDTLTIADAAGARVVHAGPCRIDQLASGARAARDEWILFLYPEVALSPGWDVEAGAFMAHVSYARPMAAAFGFALEEFDAVSRRTETLAALRSNLFKLPFGEQGLLIGRRFYESLGGYRRSPMPDVDLVRRIGSRRLVMFRARAVSKADTRPLLHRRPLSLALYALGVPANFAATL